MEIHLRNLERFLERGGPHRSTSFSLATTSACKRPADLAADVPRVLQAAPRRDVGGAPSKLANAKVMLHCCGAVRQLLPDLIDAGLDAINPVQISCRGMDAEGLKRDFGSGPDVLGRRLRHAAHPAERHAGRSPRARAASDAKCLPPGGGFVFQQVHNIMANVPPENILAMYDAVRDTTRA